MGSRRQLLSIVLPAYNEAETLPRTFERLRSAVGELGAFGVEVEFVFVNDGSSDGTAELLNGFAQSDARVRAAHLARNFGHQAAICAGLSLARGDAVVVMDADLQDPPELLPQLLAKWREGFQVVYAIRQKRREWFGKRLAYWSFYRLLHSISEIDIPLDAGDFCLMDRSAVNLLHALPERQRFVRGLRTWIGLRQTGVRYDRPAREAGETHYKLRHLFRLAMDGLVSFSSAPLRMVTRLGIIGVLIASALGVWVILDTIFIGKAPRGWASLACLVLLMSSVQLISLGVLGEYMARIFIEVKGRPTYLIADVVSQQAPARADNPSEQLETSPST